jgi:hypothetical protein
MDSNCRRDISCFVCKKSAVYKFNDLITNYSLIINNDNNINKINEYYCELHNKQCGKSQLFCKGCDAYLCDDCKISDDIECLNNIHSS